MLRPRSVSFPKPVTCRNEDEQPPLVARVTILESSEMNRAMAQSYCGHLWPSSLAVGLALCRWYAELVSDKVILELGAGTALPSSLACALSNARKSSGPQKVIATDMTLSSMPPLDQICAHNSSIDNSLLSVCPMPWGVAEALYGVLDEVQVDAVDVVLASDCLFHHDVYDRVLATFSLIASVEGGDGPGGRGPPVLVVGYQRRSSSHSIVPLLKQWNLKVTRSIKATQLAEWFLERDVWECEYDSAEESGRVGASTWSDVYERDSTWKMSGFESVDVLFIEPI